MQQTNWASVYTTPPPLRGNAQLQKWASVNFVMQDDIKGY